MRAARAARAARPARAARTALAVTVAAAAAVGSRVHAAIPEPYPWLHGGSFGPPVRSSRDDLAAYAWPPDFTGYGALQIFSAAPVAAYASAVGGGAVAGLASLVDAPYGAGTALVSGGNATLLLDFGVERPAWLELALGGPLDAACVAVAASISEYNFPRPVASGAPPGALRAFDGGLSLRLETTPALYDGLRYAFVSVAIAAGAPGCAGARVALAGARAVAQALPLNYEGALDTGDAALDRAFYTGAYAVRANALPGFFGSELLARGDRAPPFQGDAHVAQRAALAAFGAPPLYALARAMLNTTDSAARPVHDSNIASYPLMWVLTLVDYVVATGDNGTLADLAPDAAAILEPALANVFNWTSPALLRWSGWDDRLGSGFSDVEETPEARRYLWMVTLKAALRFAELAAGSPPLAPLAARLQAAVAVRVARLRGAGGAAWYDALDGGYGLHALAAAATGGWLTPAEAAAVFASRFNDSARACSFSNYDTGFILDALGELGREDFGAALVRMCWGRQLRAGATCWWESVAGVADAMQASADYDAPARAPDMDLLPGASTSACHAWGAEPTAWLPRHALGVRPLAPGFARLAVDAARLLGPAAERATRGALQRAEGRVPTPRGAVHVEHAVHEAECGRGAAEGAGASVSAGAGAVEGAGAGAGASASADAGADAGAGARPPCDGFTLTTRVRAPAGVPVTVRVARRLGGGDNDDAAGGGAALLRALVSVGGRPAAAAAAAGARARTDDVVDVRGRRAVALPAVDTGEAIVVTAVYARDAGDAGAPAAARAAAARPRARDDNTTFPPFGPAAWPSPPVAVDATTHGDWVGRVGSAGYVLFAFDAGANSSAPPLDRAALPPFVAAVAAGPGALRARATAGPGRPATSAWLQDPAEPTSRGLGALYVAAQGGLFGLFVDVTAAAGAPDFRVSAYVADTAAALAPAGGPPPDAQAVFLRVADGATRDALAPDVLVRHVPAAPPAGGAFNASWNAGGVRGLEGGLGLAAVARGRGATTRLRFYCVTGCYASVSALFFDAL